MTRDERIIISITGGSHLSVHSLMLVFPTIMLVLQQQYSVGLDTLGFIAAAGAFMFGFGAIPAGYLESRVGGYTLLLIYQLGTAFSVLMIIFSQSLGMITLSLMLLGLFSSIYHPAGLTLISRRINNISKGMAFHGIAGSVGLALGPLLAATFTDLFSWRVAYGVLAGWNILLAMGTTILIRVGHGRVVDNDLANTKATNRSALGLYYAIIVLIGFSFAGFTTFMPTHFAFETRNILSSLSDTFRGGIFTTAVLSTGIIGQYVGGYLGSRYNRANVLFWTVLLNIPFLAFIGVLSGIPMILTGLIFGVIHFNFQPIGNSLIAQYTHSSDRGIGYGISFFLSFGIGAFAAGLGGLIAENIDVAWVFPAMAFILIPGVGLSWLLKKKSAL